MKTVIVIALVLVLVSLAGAGLFMLKKTDSSPGARDNRMVRALTLRISLSIALFLFIMLSWYMGWVHPTGLPAPR